VVCDGFTGNVVLKFYESAGKVFVELIKRDAPEVLRRPDMQRVLEVFDWATYGGAPLLGVQGVSIICHGSSNAKAIKNAIRVAVQSVESHLDQDIEAEMARSQVTV
jgi:glycerol-3-phosphate acyltransferase PlsX